GNGLVQQIEENDQIVQRVPQTESNLGNANVQCYNYEEENDFMLDNAYGDDTLEELSAAVIILACIQPIDDKADAEPKYDVEAITE
ncbi:hypothetical protein Tco_1169155, partial [Tanacetum coccineum]